MLQSEFAVHVKHITQFLNIWQLQPQLLSCTEEDQKPRLDKSFFELGGDSLSMVQVKT